jgi:hypothetical protein
MKTTIYAWGAEKNNVLHIYAGMTTQTDITRRLYGVRDIAVGPRNSWFKSQEDSSTFGSWQIDLLYAESTQHYSRYKEQKAINAVWLVEQKYLNDSLPVRALNTNRAMRLKNYLPVDKAPIGKPNRWTSVYGHVLQHIDELQNGSNPEVVEAVESWIKEKADSKLARVLSPSIKRKFNKAIKAKAEKEAMIESIAKALELEAVTV